MVCRYLQLDRRQRSLTAEACSSTNSPLLVRLTNGLPFVATNSPFAAPPGPPQWVFYQFVISNFVDVVLFEMYDLSGDADLVLQRDQPPGMAPYFDGSFRVGQTPEQIVLRSGARVPRSERHLVPGRL